MHLEEKMLTCLLFLTCIFGFGQAKVDRNSTLLFVQIFFRHGDRAPLQLYPNDPNSEDIWPEGLGQLTVLGKKQHYEIGKYLRSMYDGFLTSDPNEVMVNSSEIDRCLMSAQANLASFYPPQGMWKFDEDINWQPIPVYYIPTRKDKYLNFGSSCPRVFRDTLKAFESKEAQQLKQEHKDMLDNISRITGVQATEEFNSLLLYDALYIEKRYNLVIPEGIEPYWDEFQEFALTALQWIYSSPNIIRLRAGPVLQHIIDNMNRKIAGYMPKRKVQIYSSHDLNLSTLLLALNTTKVVQPPYGATLLIELHQMSDDTKAVRLLYLNSSYPEQEVEDPHLFFLDGCSEFCPLKQLIESTRHVIPDDWNQECMLGNTSLIEQCKHFFEELYSK
ncbi:testicular acid phosphatase homolog [Nephila pilipes]|uniref:acid phosphatase n=1 Tax=Nephila pilipes TaxID=299642 RepID=A0A8X6UM88_NEPPI|nr:testicular acid phosphatase homolog [Nephila pilipes]